MQTSSISSSASLKQPNGTADTQKEGKLRKACADFESFFLQQMLTTMRASVPKGGLLGGSFADETFRSMQDEALAKKLTENQGMGIGEALYRKMQQGQSGNAAQAQRRTYGKV